MTARVAIDARAAVRREVGGVERVTQELASGLPALRPDRYLVLRPRPRLAHRAGQAWEQLALPLLARDCELLLCPANLAPLAARNNAIVLHDVAALRHPEWYAPAYVTWQRAVIPRLARRARHVITVSQWSRAELVEVLGLAPQAVTVIAGGVDERFHPGADPAPVRAVHRLERPYVLAVGTRIARKNLAALETAARHLESAGIELVVAGSGRPYLRAEEGAPGRLLGYVDDAHLPGLYAGARALVMPSLYEGFGLPCLEAMAAGTPVVAADRAALPETCGDAALLVDPADRQGLAGAVLAAATDESLRARLIARGRARACDFPWSRTVGQTDALLGRLLGESGH